MLKVILYEIFKLLFGKKDNNNNNNIDKNSRDYQILSKTLHVNNKSDMLERISYWIEKNDYAEAKKLSDLYIHHNGLDKHIDELNKKII